MYSSQYSEHRWLVHCVNLQTKHFTLHEIIHSLDACKNEQAVTVAITLSLHIVVIRMCRMVMRLQQRQH